MILINKKVGETPLELLNRAKSDPTSLKLRGARKPQLKNEKLSYAGRLDPMAEGQMLILVGEEENKNRKKYLGLDKEYEAEFLVGVSTDTGDILGEITKSQILNPKQIPNLKSQITNLKNIKKQKYPWFSSRTVKGKALWEYYREGNFSIKRPEREVKIYKSEILNKKLETNPKSEIRDYILKSIKKVKGDFRQEEILEGWRDFFEVAPNNLQTFKIKLRVSSGTYIRALTEEFDFPVCLLKLKRTKILVC